MHSLVTPWPFLKQSHVHRPHLEYCYILALVNRLAKNRHKIRKTLEPAVGSVTTFGRIDYQTATG